MPRKKATITSNDETQENLAHSANGTKVPKKAKAKTAKKQKQVKTRDGRNRYTWKFQLDAMSDTDLLLMEELATLKRNRRMTPTIRAALRLFLDLQAGNTSVLRELFPGIVEAISGTSASAEFNALIADLKRTLDATLDLSNGKAVRSKRDFGGFVDDELEAETMVISSVDPAQIAQNFFDGMF